MTEIKQEPPGFPFNQRLRDSSLLQPVLIRDEGFDIDYHVRHTVLPRPGNNEQLAEMVSRLHANLLDRERPLWEFHLIEGLSGRRFAFYTKIHHAICDGMTFARWFTESGSTSAADSDSHAIWQRDEAPEKKSDDSSFAQLIIDGVKVLGGSMKTALDLSTLSARLIQKSIFERNRNAVLPLSAPKTRLNVPTGAARNFSISHYPLPEIKAIAHSHGASINDMVLTLCDMAVNRYLKEKGEEPGEALVAYMPVDLRKEPDEKGNLISLLQVKLASDHEHPLTALEQIRESSKSTREIYGSTSRPAIQLYSLAVALLPLGEEILNLDQVLPPAINLVISNVPGPREKLYFRGAEVVEVYPVNTLPPAVGLSMTVCSYAESLYFGLIAGRSVFPDLQKLSTHLDDLYVEFRELSGMEATG